MPTNENPTLERIQREIMDVVAREKELRTFYNRNNNNNNNDEEIKPTCVSVENGNHHDQPPLTRAQSVSALYNGETSNSNGFRRFAPNPNARGVMQKFFKARGKLANVTALIHKKNNHFAIPDFVPSQVIVEPGKRIRNGFVPIEERMKSELQDAYNREKELQLERRKSQPNLSALLDFDMIDSPQMNGNGLRAAKSMAQLYDSNENLDETVSAPSSLKQAKSLADLCDAADNDDQPPGSHSLIMQFENIIMKNQQART